MSESKQKNRGLHPYTVIGTILAAVFIVGVAACQSSEARGGAGAYAEMAQGPGGPGAGMGTPPNGPPPGAQGAGSARGAPRPTSGSGLLARKGGASVIEIEGQILEGNLAADRASAIAVVLRGDSTWTGSINADKAAKAASVSLDATSRWIVAADSYVTSLTAPMSHDGSTVAGIEGDGHSVHYDARANPWLGGKTYALEKGGSLLPY